MTPNQNAASPWASNAAPSLPASARILGASIAELTSGVSRIDIFPEQVEQFFVFDFLWIINNFHHFHISDGETGSH